MGKTAQLISTTTNNIVDRREIFTNTKARIVEKNIPAIRYIFLTEIPPV